jgi:hypothetical protein
MFGTEPFDRLGETETKCIKQLNDNQLFEENFIQLCQFQYHCTSLEYKNRLLNTKAQITIHYISELPQNGRIGRKDEEKR